jgi:hypothetical protein
LKFIAIDEAQQADEIYPNVFISVDLRVKCSALSILLIPISNLGSNVVLCGTRLSLKSSFEILGSSAAKENTIPRLIGPTSYFEDNTLRAAIKRCGYTFDVNPGLLTIFRGRPRHAMCLEKALILNLNIDLVINDIVDNTKRKFAVMRVMNVYRELYYAALEWILRGKVAIIGCGDIALEQC